MSTLGSFIWSIADQLRGPYRPNQYGTVVLPFTILRRIDCVLEPDREVVRELASKFENPNRLKVEVKKATGRTFYNTSNYSFANLLADADGLADNLADYWPASSTRAPSRPSLTASSPSSRPPTPLPTLEEGHAKGRVVVQMS